MGIEAVPIEVQVQLASGMPAFSVVGLPDKAVAESRERVRAALSNLGLSLPPQRITVNLSPADLQKEGSHYDLAIALGILVTLGCLTQEDIQNHFVLGELALDGRISSVSGVLPSAILAASQDRGIICPAVCGSEAAWVDGISVVAAPDLLALMNHFKGTQQLPIPKARLQSDKPNPFDLIDIRGQETAKRALEIAAAGAHNLLLQGPPGAGKSMLANRLPSILPPLTPEEALEVTMIHSLASTLSDGELIYHRPFREPHHSSSLPALVGGGIRAKPGEVSLAHLGVLFLDELPEFSRATLETLRQPLESGKVMIARANAHITYPARFQLIAAMNPCRCGYMDDPERACSRVPRCAQDYQSKISGPLLDRIDLSIFVPAVTVKDLGQPGSGESSAAVRDRVLRARERQRDRLRKLGYEGASATNSILHGKALEEAIIIDGQSKSLLEQACEKFKLSARGYHRILKVSRTIADLENSLDVRSPHIAEAIGFRHYLGSA